MARPARRLRLDANYRRRRERGDWELVAIAFVVSGYVDIQPWHANATDDVWTACGFAAKPSYRTTWRRLRELGDVADEFLRATGMLVRRARSRDSRVMAHVHFDNTEDETHAALVHDCERSQGHAAGRGFKESHGTYEATHDWWRDRYKVAADHLGIRPKVRDIAFHRLRANVAALVEWLRICHIQGWLSSPSRHERRTKRKFQDRADVIQNKLANMRVRMGVAAPYGAKAEQLQVGQRTPPSRRARGAPPGRTALDIPA